MLQNYMKANEILFLYATYIVIFLVLKSNRFDIIMEILMKRVKTLEILTQLLVIF